jgi:hypothetical protein
MSGKLDVGVNGVEIEELKGADVDVALTCTTTIVDEFSSSSGNPLEGDWVGFLDADALEAGTQRDAGQCTTGLHNVGQPNTGLYYTRQNDVEHAKAG